MDHKRVRSCFSGWPVSRTPAIAVLAVAMVTGVIPLPASSAAIAMTVVIDRNVIATADDAEESAAGVVVTNDSDLELVLDSSLQTVGVRFTGMTIPVGSIITAAWLQFETDEKKTAAASLTIRGIAADNTPAFVNKSPYNISSRPRTTASVNWSPAAWNIPQERGTNQRTPDLSGLLTEIVSRPSWASGNAVGFVITGTGVRTAESFNGTRAPALHVEFIPPEGGTNKPPTVNAGPDQTIMSSATVNLQATVGDDGLPISPGTTSVTWTATGPGTVTFGNRNSAVTTAKFAVEGTYILRAAVTDGALTTYDELTVSVVVSVTPGDGWLIRSAGDNGRTTWAGSAADDPIVYPGQPGRAHMHDFLCNQATTADATYESMVAAPTTCPSGDTAGYWAPALYKNGVKIDPTGGSTRQQIYYRRNNLATNTIVTPFPPDFRMVIGSPHATSLAEANATGSKLGSEHYWGCSDNSESGKPTAPVNCGSGIITLHVGFPNCWNGVKVPGDQVKAGTMEYPSGGVCPPGFPVALPRLMERFEYPVGTSSSGITISSGNTYSIHADFWNTWHQPSLEFLVAQCMNSKTVVCGTNPTVTLPGNQSPIVSAGSDKSIVQPNADTLNGTMRDDGLPTPVSLTATWSMVSGPGTVTFANAAMPATTATFSASGAYVLRLTVTDGALITRDDVVVTVTDPVNQPPTANAGADRTVVMPTTATLTGTVTDDGLPVSGTLTTIWSQVSGPGTVTFLDATTPATTATFSQVGTYVVRLTATDGDLTTSDDATVTVTDVVAPSSVIDVPVRLSADDAEEIPATGATQLSSSDLELVKDTTDQVVGLRFSNVAIPAGSVISAAWVQFETDELSSAAVSLTVRAEATDNALSFTTTPFNVSSRPRTVASAAWTPPPWTVLQERGVGQRTSSLTPVLQEVIARPGWAAGNAVAIVLTGTGARTAEAFDGTAAPVLHVEFTPTAS